jgi:hypothetical protein
MRGIDPHTEDNHPGSMKISILKCRLFSQTMKSDILQTKRENGIVLKKWGRDQHSFYPINVFLAETSLKPVSNWFQT